MQIRVVKLTLVTIIAALFFEACHNSDPKVISRIDSLLKVLDTTNKIASTIDFSKEKENAKKIEEDLALIQTNFKDTLDKEMGILLFAYKGIIEEGEEEGSKSENYSNMLKKELDFSKTQLINLKHDFEKTDLTPEDFKKYFETEAIAVSKLNLFVKDKQEEFLRKEKQFSEMQPKVQAFIDSLPR